MNIVIYARTPVAGHPYQQWKCLSKYTDHSVHFITRVVKYPDGREFPYELLDTDPKSKEIIRSADIVHVHNYLDPIISQNVDKAKQRVIATFHSCPRFGSWTALYNYAHKSYVIRQPMQMREYTEFDSLPSMFDIWEHIPIEKKEGKIKIAFAPSSKAGIERLESKSRDYVLQRIEHVLEDFPIYDFLFFEGKPYLENLELKSRSNILIDDVTPNHDTFHLTSLEGCSFGLTVLTGIGKSEGYPFVKTTVDTLYQDLSTLAKNPTLISEYGFRSRKWVEENWNPRDQVNEFIDRYNET